MPRARTVDWPNVEAAMRRSKRGVATKDDIKLCERAYRVQPEEYARRKQAIDEAIVRDERERWRW